MPHFKANSSIEWYYETQGSGEALLFIHGWGLDRRIWRQQLKHFAEKFKVLSIDLPGHGKSSWQKVSLTDMTKDINQILKLEGIDMVTIIGSSLGGLFSLKFYGMFPEKVSRMIFVGSMPKFSQSDDYPHGLDIEEMKKLGGQVENAYPEIIDVFFRSLFTKEERQTRRYKWLQKFRRFDAKPMQGALVEYLNILEKEDLRDDLARVKVPMQFINGTEDNICSKDTIIFLKETTHDDTRFDLFHKCGHFPFLSMPYEFNNVLEDFLKQT